MKRFIHLLVLLAGLQTGFAQNKLQDGIYLIDASAAGGVNEKNNKAIVEVNPNFFEGDPDTYKPLVVSIDDFVPFKLAAAPVIQHHNSSEGEVLVHLTDSTAQQLNVFTARNLMKQIVVVVDNQAIAVYKIFQPVSNGLIKITKCTGSACGQVSRQLKNTFKS